MFQKLKECKTFKEIFTLIGTKPFDKVAYILVIAWCLLPIYSAIHRAYWAVIAVNEMQQRSAVESGYKLAVQLVGSLSLYVAIFFLVSRVSVYGKACWQKVKKEPWHFFLLAMLLWSCISTILSDNISRSYNGTDYRFDGLKTYFFYAGAYVCAFLVVQGKRRWRALNVFNVVANVISLFVILQDAGVAFMNRCFLDVRAAVFLQFNHTGYYLNLGIVCAMGLYLYESSRKLRIWYAFSMAFQIYAILVNSTLGSFLGTCGALVMILVFFVRKYSKVAWRMLTPILVVAILIAASYFGYVPTSSGQDMRVNFETLFKDGKAILFGTDDADDAGHGRMTLWKQSLQMIPKRPIFGYGPEQLDEELSEIMWVDRPDNEFIQHAVFLGVPGLLFYLSALIWLFIHQWVHLKRLDRTTLVAAGCLIAYLISSLFGNTMFYTTPYLYIFWALAAGRRVEASEQVATE